MLADGVAPDFQADTVLFNLPHADNNADPPCIAQIDQQSGDATRLKLIAFYDTDLNALMSEHRETEKIFRHLNTAVRKGLRRRNTSAARRRETDAGDSAKPDLRHVVNARFDLCRGLGGDVLRGGRCATSHAARTVHRPAHSAARTTPGTANTTAYPAERSGRRQTR